MEEKEQQRCGRIKDTQINDTYICSGKYRRKFDAISNSKRLSRCLYRITKKILKHCTGTHYEDMYWIDLDSLKIVAKETTQIVEKQIVYSEKTKKHIKEYTNLITIHSHPDSFPPSIQDFNSNFIHNYALGIVVCHNGCIYIYNANEMINEKYYKLTVEAYIKSGYNEYGAQVAALKEIEKSFDIKFKEVTENDGL